MIEQHIHGIGFYLSWILGPGAGILGAISWAANKFFISPLQQAWKSATDTLDRIEKVQGVQAENHLLTIENNTTRTNELLQAIHDGQLEMSGFLRGMSGKS